MGQEKRLTGAKMILSTPKLRVPRELVVEEEGFPKRLQQDKE